MMEAKPTRPVMRWYGGKARLAKEIVGLMPAHSTYVEAFGGAASVLMQKPPVPCEVYNDLYDEVVNLFRQLRDAPEALIRGIWLTPYARAEYHNAYRKTSDPLEAARQFIFRSTVGYGSDAASRQSGFRTSLDDGKWSPAAPWANKPEELWAVARRLRNCIIEHKAAKELLPQFDGEDTLFYLDPPYLASTRKATAAKVGNRFARGYVHEMMAEEEHADLLDLAKGLRGKVMISGYDSPLYREALAGWGLHEMIARDQLNEHRRELLWMNYEPPAAKQVQGELL